MQNHFFSILFFVFSLASSAAEFTADTRFQKSLSLFNELQTRASCVNGPKYASQCSHTLSKLIEDDNESRLGFSSMAATCRGNLESAKASNVKGMQDFRSAESLQHAFQVNRTEYLGDNTNESIKACMLSSNTRNKDVVSKFYHYAIRLNEAASKIAQEQVIIGHYLKDKKTACPNPYLLAAANDTCEKVKSCSNQETFEKLLERVPQEEELFIQTKAALNKFPKDCKKDENCQKEKAALSAVLAGLADKNPWFINEEFNSNKNKWPLKKRLEDYLKLAKENLNQQQSQLEKAAMCIHTNSEECKIDEIREILFSTARIPDQSGGANSTEKVLDNYMNYQSCLEDWSQDRNHASKIVGGGLKDTVLGLAVLPIGARWAAGKAGKIVLAEAVALMGADTALNVLMNREVLKDFSVTCFSPDKIAFQYKKLPQKDLCEKSDAGLSSGSQDRSACLVNSGLLALGSLPFVGIGYNVVRYAKNSGMIKSAATVASEAVETARISRQAAQTAHASTTTATAKNLVAEASQATDVAKASPASGKRAVDAIAQTERRQGGALKSILCESCLLETVIDHPATPNLPKSMRIIESKKIDGSKSLYYKTPVKLNDGYGVANVREFQIDEVTGGINANYPTGRQLFEEIAVAKAGKAYFAFFDVGSLGFVNKSFKAGEEAGDRYLKGVADKIREIGGDKVTLARTGGDEFGLIIDEVDPVKAKALVEKIQDSIRKDLKGDAKRVFFEEKVDRAQKFREALAKLEAENPKGVTAEQKAELLKNIEELAKVQQPDVSIGITQIGAEDRLTDLAARSEEQAKQMKILTALEFGRSAEKYGSKKIPNARPKPMYVAPVADPIPSTSWKSVRNKAGDLVHASATLVDELPVMKVTPKEEVLRFSDISVVRSEDELGESIYKTERFITDPITQKRSPVITEIPTRGGTGLLDGTHSEGQAIISRFIVQPETSLVMPKLRSLKYLNYFESGTQAGDTVLEAIADVIKKNTRPYDLNLKLDGADFLMGVKNKAPQDMKEFYKKVTEQVKDHPRVKEVLANEGLALAAKLAKAKALNDVEMIATVQQRINDLAHFDLDLQFQMVQKSELSSQPNLKEIKKTLDNKFPAQN